MLNGLGAPEVRVQPDLLVDLNRFAVMIPAGHESASTLPGAV